MCTHAKLFEIELIICIKMDLALNNQQRPNQPTNQPLHMLDTKEGLLGLFYSV